MMDGTMGHRRTGLTRAKSIERLTLWLGLPLLLLLLCLTAGIVNYAPVRDNARVSQGEPEAAAPAPAEEAPPAPSIPARADRLLPLEPVEDLGHAIDLGADPPIS